MPVTVFDGTRADATAFEHQRRTFRNPRGLGWYYTFLRDGTTTWSLYKSETGSSWADELGNVLGVEMDFTIWEDSANSRLILFIARTDSSGNIEFEVWKIDDASSNAEQLFVDLNIVAPTDDGCTGISVALAEDGYVWIGWCDEYTDMGKQRSQFRLMCTEDTYPVATTTYTTPTDWDFGGTQQSVTQGKVIIVPLSATADVGIIVCVDNDTSAYQAWCRTGSYAGSGSPSLGTVTFVDGLTSDMIFSAVAESGATSDVFIAFIVPNLRVRMRKWDISADNVSLLGDVNTYTDDTSMSIAIDKTLSPNIIYCFYTRSSVSGDVLYKTTGVDAFSLSSENTIDDDSEDCDYLSATYEDWNGDSRIQVVYTTQTTDLVRWVEVGKFEATKDFVVDGRLVNENTKDFVVNGVLQAEQTKDFVIDAVIYKKWVESWDSWTAVSEAWENKDLSPYGVPGGAICKVVIANENTGTIKTVGVRIKGSSLSRFVTLDAATDGGVDAVLMTVKADGVGFIEAIGSTNCTFYLVGYWMSNAPTETAINYTEVAPDTYTIGSSGSWTTKATSLTYASKFIEVLLRNTKTDGGNSLGVRNTSSSVDRRLDLGQAQSGGGDYYTATVWCDASFEIECYAEGHTSGEFIVIGYWAEPPEANYAEKIYSLSDVIADVWNDNDISGGSIPEGVVGEFVIGNGSITNERWHGVRQDSQPGSPRDRRLQLRESQSASDYDLCTLTTEVEKPSSIEIVERYQDDLSDNDAWCIGYWSASAVITYTKDFDVNALLQDTFTKNFLVDGLLQDTFTKDFEVDARLVNVKTKDFDVNGILQATFTKDFEVDGCLVDEVTKDFVVDGLLQDTYTKDFEVDGILMEEGTKDFIVDGYLAGVITKDFEVDGILQDTFTKDFEVDGRLVNVRTKDFEVDAYLFGSATKDFLVDGVLLNSFTKDFVVDGRLVDVGTKDFVVDGILQDTFTKTFDVDGLLMEEFTKDFEVDGVLAVVYTKEFIVDGLLSQEGTKDFVVDGRLTGSATKDFEVDGLLQDTFTKDFIVDGRLVNEITKDFEVDGVLKATDQTKDFEVDGILQDTFTKDFEVDGVLWDTFTKDFEVDGLLQITPTKDFEVDGLLQLTSTKDFEVDGRLVNVNTKDFEVDGMLLDEVTKDFEVDGLLQLTSTKDFVVDAILSSVAEVSIYFEVDGILQAEQTKVFRVNAILQIGRHVTFRVDGVLRYVGTKDFVVDGVLQAESQVKIFRVDGILQAENQTKDFEVDAILVNQGTKNFLVDGVLKAESQTKTFTVDGILAGGVYKIYRHHTLKYDVTVEGTVLTSPNSITINRRANVPATATMQFTNKNGKYTDYFGSTDLFTVDIGLDGDPRFAFLGYPIDMSGRSILTIQLADMMSIINRAKTQIWKYDNFDGWEASQAIRKLIEDVNLSPFSQNFDLTGIKGTNPRVILDDTLRYVDFASNLDIIKAIRDMCWDRTEDPKIPLGYTMWQRENRFHFKKLQRIDEAIPVIEYPSVDSLLSSRPSKSIMPLINKVTVLGAEYKDLKTDDKKRYKGVFTHASSIAAFGENHQVYTDNALTTHWQCKSKAERIGVASMVRVITSRIEVPELYEAVPNLTVLYVNDSKYGLKGNHIVSEVTVQIGGGTRCSITLNNVEPYMTKYL